MHDEYMHSSVNEKMKFSMENEITLAFEERSLLYDLIHRKMVEMEH